MKSNKERQCGEIKEEMEGVKWVQKCEKRGDEGGAVAAFDENGLRVREEFCVTEMAF